MGDINRMTQYAAEVYDYIYAEVQSIFAGVQCIFADTQAQGADFPEHYVFISQTENPPDRFAMCYNSYEGSNTLTVELNVPSGQCESGRAMMYALALKFLQGFDKYAIIVGKAKSTNMPTTYGHRFVYTVTYTFVY